MREQTDRRGDRRREQWSCQNRACGATDARAELEHDGTVYCTRCGTVDRRSTAGNRRDARRALRALEERIERDMGAALERLDRLEEAEYTAGNERAQLRAELREAERIGREARDDADDAKRAAERAQEAADTASRGW